ncbi:hypothetical protein ACFQLX_09415 [Streptomyces polyrhachis]|uniref:Bacterial Ig-like domain-containing protein n=1 Tax=Streptomyces polyrhachis TaxID=1282885 RepID=A0ABW2GGC0_9ACTN
MSKAPAKKGNRPLTNGIDASGAFPVEYRFAHAKGGNRHLVVVFANFSAPDDYGWSNGVFDNVRANILWIRDRFDGMNSYYLCRDMDFSLEQSVMGVITNVMRSLGLTPDDVTMWGGSKGGSAALYFGLRYGFRNIVSIVPQFQIGTYVATVHPKVARYMLGEGVPAQNVRAVDAVLPELVRSEVNREANVYLLSSPQDEQYKTQVEPFLGLFQRYENFNFFYSESPTITDHTQVTRRNVPVLIGLLNFLADGLAPRLGFVRNGYEDPDHDRSAIHGYLKSTSLVKDNSVFPPPAVLDPAPQSILGSGRIRFTGSAPRAVRVSLWEHGKFLGSPPVAVDGSWTWELERPWTAGKHLLRLFGVDAAGFHSERTEFQFTVSQGAPQQHPQPAPNAAAPVDPSWRAQGLTPPVVAQPGNYEQLAAGRIRFAGQAAGASQVGVRADGRLLGGCRVAPDGNWVWEAEWAWPEGTHTVEVVAADSTGTESPGVPVVFSVMPVAVHSGYGDRRF